MHRVSSVHELIKFEIKSISCAVETPRKSEREIKDKVGLNIGVRERERMCIR